MVPRPFPPPPHEGSGSETIGCCERFHSSMSVRGHCLNFKTSTTTAGPSCTNPLQNDLPKSRRRSEYWYTRDTNTRYLTEEVRAAAMLVYVNNVRSILLPDLHPRRGGSTDPLLRFAVFLVAIRHTIRSSGTVVDRPRIIYPWIDEALASTSLASWGIVCDVIRYIQYNIGLISGGSP